MRRDYSYESLADQLLHGYRRLMQYTGRPRSSRDADLLPVLEKQRIPVA
jgi:hypothetical protein